MSEAMKYLESIDSAVYTHQLMMKDCAVLLFNISNGLCKIKSEIKLPLDLNIRVSNEPLSIEDRVHNLSVIKAWCARRTLSMSKSHAKRICNALAISQEDSDEVKYHLALTYKCLSLDDAYWVKSVTEDVQWGEVNLFHNSSRNALTPISLKNDNSTIFNKKLKNSSDLGVDGTYAKSWVRDDDGVLYLLKADDVDEDETVREVCASKVLDCFNVCHADYELSEYDGLRVSKSRIFTSEDFGLVKFKVLKKHLQRKGIKALDWIKQSEFAEDYYKLCVFTYLLGNEDLHGGNWGFLCDMDTGQLKCLAPLYDFNCAFMGSYLKGRAADYGFMPEVVYLDEEGNEVFDSQMLDFIDYQIVRPRKLEDAAIEAVARCNIVQTGPVTPEIFPSYAYYEEFLRRCAVLGLVVGQ